MDQHRLKTSLLPEPDHRLFDTKFILDFEHELCPNFVRIADVSRDVILRYTDARSRNSHTTRRST